MKKLFFCMRVHWQKIKESEYWFRRFWKQACARQNFIFLKNLHGPFRRRSDGTVNTIWQFPVVSFEKSQENPPGFPRFRSRIQQPVISQGMYRLYLKSPAGCTVWRISESGCDDCSFCLGGAFWQDCNWSGTVRASWKIIPHKPEYPYKEIPVFFHPIVP